MQIIKSELDNSVNFIVDAEKGKFESRFVQRSPDYFIVYLSSQSGCNQGCRMCHLTNTKQTQFVNATVEDYTSQAIEVLKYYKENINKPVEKIHFNFMARGEPLDNPHFIEHNALLFWRLRSLFSEYAKDFRFNVSTIMPLSFYSITTEKSFQPKLYDVFEKACLAGMLPSFYYSLYSVKEGFRQKWIPKAINYRAAIQSLKEWQDKTNLIPKIHFAFIEGENDSENEVVDLCLEVNKKGLKVNVNVVRYNPYSDMYGKESSKSVIERNVTIMKILLNCNVKIIPKVGFDVKASCGMFVEKSV